MSKDNIELSPKYGLNPTIPICFFCGEPKPEIAIMGRMRKHDENGRPLKGSDIEAPKHMILDYTPCDKCNEIMQKGITLIGVKPSDGRHLDISKGFYPVGNFVTVQTEGFDHVFKDVLDKNTYDNVIKTKRLLIDSDELDKLTKNVNS